MSAGSFAPRRFGSSILVAALGEDALGRVYRAIRLTGERGFVRLRILESPEISEDAVLDAIESNGEIHGFLKNPAITRGVQMDAVDGTPYIAWSETSGRTLDAVLLRLRESGSPIPIEHGLLIAEKIATALDHAYNTTVDAERTLHGLVWPGFVCVSDDGEVQLTGFGLAPGFFRSFGHLRFAGEVGPYLAREERSGATIGRNSDVYSVGAILFELLTGGVPTPADPLSDLRVASEKLPPEVTEVLRMCLGEPSTRYQTAGELRRELGKLLFSGPYAPSTFNLAFFLHGLFAAEIEAENRARAEEAELDTASFGAPEIPAPAIPRVAPPAGAFRGRAPVAIGSALLVAAGLVGSGYLILRRPPASGAVSPPRARPTAIAPVLRASVAPPEPTSPPTNSMSDARFKEEVSRRVSAELRRLEDELDRARAAAAVPRPAEPPRKAAAVPAVAEAGAPPTPVAAVAAAAARIEPTSVPSPPPAEPAAPEPTPIRERETASPPPAAEPAISVLEEAPKIRQIVKPVYPPAALRARIGGTVLLRVLVSESGTPVQVDVVRGASAGLTEAAVAAVRRWTFEPARKNGVAVPGWTTIPIPFQP